MKAITYNVTKNGSGYVRTTLVPANSTEARKENTWGLVIAGGLLMLTAAFITMLLLAL